MSRNGTIMYYDHREPVVRSFFQYSLEFLKINLTNISLIIFLSHNKFNDNSWTLQIRQVLLHPVFFCYVLNLAVLFVHMTTKCLDEEQNIQSSRCFVYTVLHVSMLCRQSIQIIDYFSFSSRCSGMIYTYLMSSLLLIEKRREHEYKKRLQIT